MFQIRHTTPIIPMNNNINTIFTNNFFIIESMNNKSLIHVPTSLYNSQTIIFLNIRTTFIFLYNIITINSYN